MANYEQMVDTVNDVESGAKRSELSFVDISGLLGAPEKKERDVYGDMLGLVEDMEARQRPAAKEKAQAAKEEQVEQQARAEREFEEVQRAELQKRQELRMQEQQARKAESVRAAEARRQAGVARNENIRREMRAVVGGLGAVKPKFGNIKLKRVNTKGLVLPNLQISDQIQELERIISALSTGALDEEQLRVVRDELAGLAQHVDDLKRELSRERRSLNELDQSLWNMRDQRLADAMSLARGGS